MCAFIEQSVTRVIHRIRPLPVFPFRSARAVVSGLTAPLDRAPPLQELCATALDGFTAAEGDLFCRAAEGLHVRHRLPFVLSRVAASRAMASLGLENTTAQGKISRVVFMGSRQSSRDLHGCELSLSHEDCLGAAVAWVPDAPSSCCSASSFLTSSGATENKVRFNSVSHEGSVGTKDELICAVDVCPVAEVHRVRLRFPQLGPRWMPQCVTDAPNNTVEETLRAIENPWLEQPINAVVGDNDAAYTESRRHGWWQHLPHPCTNEREAYASLVLAQHWGARECVIKLLGIPGRSFPYACVHRGLSTNAEDSCPSSLPLTTSFMRPHTLYQGSIRGSERVVWQRAGLDPLIHLYSWVEWCPHSAGTDMPYAVVVGCCCSATKSAHRTWEDVSWFPSSNAVE